MKRGVTFLIILFSVLSCWAQTQQGVVKTRGKMVNGKLQPGIGLAGAMVTIQGRNAVQSQANGTFSFPIPSKTFMLQSVQKNGYQLVDADAMRKAYQYSPNIFYIIMETPDQQKDDELAAARKIRRTLQKQLQQREEELEELKAQNKLTQEEYRKALDQLYNDQQNNEKLIADMAKEYAAMDYDQMDELNRQISDAILNGELMRADSLLRSKGDINSRDAEITRRLEAEAKRKKEIAREQEELATSEEGTRKLLEDFAEDCYNYYNMYKLENKYDSAAYYIELRANRDTTNAGWQIDAGNYLHKQNQFYKAEPYYKRLLNPSLHIPIHDVLAAVNNLATLYTDLRRFDDSYELLEKAVSICQDLAKTRPELYEADLEAALLNSLARSYKGNEKLTEAESAYRESLAIRRRLAISNPELYEQDLAGSLNNLAMIFEDTHRMEESEKMYSEALSIYLRLAERDPQQFEEYVALTKNNLAGPYMDKQQYDDAERLYIDALEIRKRLASENPIAYNSDLAGTYYNLGSLYMKTGKLEKSEMMSQNALKIYRGYIENDYLQFGSFFVKALSNLASVNELSQNYEEAEKLYLEGIEFSKEQAKYDPQTYEYYLTALFHLLGSMYFSLNKYEDASRIYEEDITILKRLSESNPGKYVEETAHANSFLGIQKYNLKHYSEAAHYLADALTFYKERAKTDNEMQESYQFVLKLLSSAYTLANNYESAYHINKEWLPLLKQDYKRNPEAFRNSYVQTLGVQSYYCVLMRQFAEAELMVNELFDIDSTQYGGLGILAASQLFQGKRKKAEQLYIKYKDELKDTFLDYLKQFAEAGVIPPEYEADVEKIKRMLEESANELELLQALNNQASSYYKNQRYAEAEKMYLSVLEIYQRLSKQNPNTYEPGLAVTLFNLGLIKSDQMLYSESITSFEEALGIYKRLTEKSSTYQEMYESSLNWLSFLYPKISNYPVAYQTNQEWISILKKKYENNPDSLRQIYAEALGSQSFYAIFMKNYQEAELFAYEGLSIDSTRHFIYSNLASSKLLQGKFAEAETIYRQYKEELKDSFLDDFKQFAEAGVIPPEHEADVEKIKRMLEE